MRIDCLTTFPNIFDSYMNESMMKRAQDKGLLEFNAHQLRDWTHDKHRTTDDEVYGAAEGLLMKCEPIFEAMDELLNRKTELYEGERDCCFKNFSSDELGDGKSESSSVAASRKIFENNNTSPSTNYGVRTIIAAPQGKQFDDKLACELAKEDRLIFICGHYEGIDERVYSLATDVISIGDYVLTSGELSSMVIIDAVVRKIPGVLHAETGAIEESFASTLLEHPQYTRPASYRGMDVPEVLTSGDDAAIAKYNREQAIKRTWEARPDLIEVALRNGELSEQDQEFLRSLKL